MNTPPPTHDRRCDACRQGRPHTEDEHQTSVQFHEEWEEARAKQEFVETYYYGADDE